MGNDTITVRFLTACAGPDTSIQPGDEVTLPADEALRHLEAGHAEPVGSTPATRAETREAPAVAITRPETPGDDAPADDEDPEVPDALAGLATPPADDTPNEGEQGEGDDAPAETPGDDAPAEDATPEA